MTKPLKNKTVYFRMTSEEHKALVNLARKMRTDKSGAMRAVLAIGVKLLVKALKDGSVEVFDPSQPAEGGRP